MLQAFKFAFESKKFQAFLITTIATLLVPVISKYLGIVDNPATEVNELIAYSEQISMYLVGLASAFCLGQGFADGLTGGRTSNVVLPPTAPKE